MHNHDAAPPFFFSDARRRSPQCVFYSMCIAYGRLTYSTSVPHKRRRKKKRRSTKEKTNGNKSLVSVQLCALPSPFFFLRDDCCLSSCFFDALFILPSIFPLPSPFTFSFVCFFLKHHLRNIAHLPAPLCLGKAQAFFFFFFF